MKIAINTQDIPRLIQFFDQYIYDLYIESQDKADPKSKEEIDFLHEVTKVAIDLIFQRSLVVPRSSLIDYN